MNVHTGLNFSRPIPCPPSCGCTADHGEQSVDIDVTGDAWWDARAEQWEVEIQTVVIHSDAGSVSALPSALSAKEAEALEEALISAAEESAATTVTLNPWGCTCGKCGECTADRARDVAGDR